MPEIAELIKGVKELNKVRIPAPWETNYTGNIWGDTDNPEHDGDSPLIARTDGQTAEARFIVASANAIMPIIARVEELEREKFPLWLCKEDGSIRKVPEADEKDFLDLKAELATANERIAELGKDNKRLQKSLDKADPAGIYDDNKTDGGG